MRDRMTAAATELTYDAPAADWLAALPLGNGRIGAMWFGGTSRDRIALNDETLWSGSPGTTAATTVTAKPTISTGIRPTEASTRPARPPATASSSGSCLTRSSIA